MKTNEKSKIFMVKTEGHEAPQILNLVIFKTIILIDKQRIEL